MPNGGWDEFAIGGLGGLVVFGGLALLRMLWGNEHKLIGLLQGTVQEQANQIGSMVESINTLQAELNAERRLRDAQLQEERRDCDEKIAQVREDLEAEIVALKSQLGYYGNKRAKTCDPSQEL